MSMVFFIIFVAVLFVVILLFSSPSLSPVPYFPSNKKDINLITQALKIRNDQTIIDLGAGDGMVIFKAADIAYKQKLNTKFIGIDINPILIFIMTVRCLFHPNRNNIKIVHGDMFKINLSDLITKSYPLVTIYLYISPWLIEKTIKNCKLGIKKTAIVSYMYPVKSLKKTEKTIQGVNKIFIYK